MEPQVCRLLFVKLEHFPLPATAGSPSPIEGDGIGCGKTGGDVI